MWPVQVRRAHRKGTLVHECLHVARHGRELRGRCRRGRQDRRHHVEASALARHRAPAQRYGQGAGTGNVAQGILIAWFSQPQISQQSPDVCSRLPTAFMQPKVEVGRSVVQVDADAEDAAEAVALQKWLQGAQSLRGSIQRSQLVNRVPPEVPQLHQAAVGIEVRARGARRERGEDVQQVLSCRLRVGLVILLERAPEGNLGPRGAARSVHQELRSEVQLAPQLA
mmetsp:Transcript_92480/g.298934  ORF Transcript_92480/g.298934 Transcript_92480/m.298934 type:complete len:225 (+) Transcript_92480:1350-2024(+)